jgi:hypothetical protein
MQHPVPAQFGTNFACRTVAQLVFFAGGLKAMGFFLYFLSNW